MTRACFKISFALENGRFYQDFKNVWVMTSDDINSAPLTNLLLDLLHRPMAPMISSGHKREPALVLLNLPAGGTVLFFQGVDDAAETQIRSAAALPPDCAN
jgi:hypothetical protein